MNQLWLCLSVAVASGAFFAGRIPVFYGVAFCALIFLLVLWKADIRRSALVLLALASFLTGSFMYGAKDHGGEFQSVGIVKESRENSYDLSIPYFKTVRVLSRKAPTVGSRVRLKGKILKPELPQNPGGFNGVHYELSHRIKHTVRPIREEVGESRSLLSRIYGLRESFQRYGRNTMRFYFPKGEADLLSAMVYGTDSDWDQFQDLNTLNLIHILSISGLHIGLMVVMLKKLSKLLTLPIAWAKIAIHFSMLVYLFLTGFPVGGMRVYFALLFTDWGKALGQPVDPTYAFSFSGLLFLLANPFYIYHYGFLFSFLSVFAILFLYPKVKYVARGKGKWAEGMLLSATITLVIVPLLSSLYGKFSLMSIVANVFVLPLASLLLYSAVALSVFHLVFQPLAGIIALFLEMAMALFNGLVGFFADFSAGVPLPSFTVYDGFFYMAVVLIGFYFPFRFLTKKSGYFLIGYTLLSTAVSLFFFRAPDYDLLIHQLYVGQGDCALVEFPGYKALIDTGGSGFGKDPTAFYITPYLRRRNIRHLDGVFLSHYDIDHVGGIFTIAKDMKINRIYGPVATGKEDKAMGKKIEEEVGKIHSIEGIFPMKGGTIKVYPSLGKEGNSLSMVMELSSKGAHALFLGDLPAAEEKMLTGLDPKSTVLKLAHHGSKTSSSEELLEAVHPKLALISAGARNSYGHPHKEVLDRLKEHHIPYLQTKDGAISLAFRRGKIQVSVYDEASESSGDAIFFIWNVIFLGASAWIISIYLRERKTIWNQWISAAPIYSTGRRNTVWSRSGVK